MMDSGQNVAMSATPQPMPAMPLGPQGHSAPMPVGGPAYPVPPPPPAHTSGKQPSSSMPIIAGVGVVAVLGIGIAVFALRGKGSNGDNNDAIILPSSAGPTTVVVASDPTPTTPSSAAPTTSATGSDTKPSTGSTATTTTTTATGPKTDPAAEKACDSAITYATGGNTMLAISQYRSCAGPRRSAALSAINGSAMREVKTKGCAAKPVADAAASIGATAAKGALPAKCK